MLRWLDLRPEWPEAVHSKDPAKRKGTILQVIQQWIRAHYKASQEVAVTAKTAGLLALDGKGGGKGKGKDGKTPKLTKKEAAALAASAEQKPPKKPKKERSQSEPPKNKLTKEDAKKIAQASLEFFDKKFGVARDTKGKVRERTTKRRKKSQGQGTAQTAKDGTPQADRLV